MGLDRRPGHLFRPEELAEMHSYFVFASHDGVAAVVSRTAEKAEELRRRLQNWNPHEDRAWYLSIVK
jgi:hypothetical protein